jgi:septum formation protein
MVTDCPRPEFVLASASKARRLLLQAAGIDPVVCASDFDESQVPISAPAEYVTTLARGKAARVAPRFAHALVLGCDSVLVLAGEIHGKPAAPAEAIARWQAMRGQTGDLYTGHVLIAPQGLTLSRCAVTRVHFAEVDDPTIQAYVDSGEPLACAGAFAIDGKGGILVDRIEGCHTNVIGLSLPVLRSMLEELGYPIRDFW